QVLRMTKRGVQANERVFRFRNFERIGVDYLGPMCEELGITKISPHGWRHTCASHLLMLGKTPKDVQTVLGHKKISTTLDTYGHLLEEYKRGITDGMDEGMRWRIQPNVRVVSFG